jgi:hypothetical protein
MGVVNTTYTFNATDVVTSAKLNNVIDETTFTSSAIATGNNTLSVTTSGQLKVNSSGITANELGDNSVITAKILDGNVTTAKILDANVTTAKILNSNVTAAKLSGSQSGSAPIFGARAYGSFDGTATSPITPINAGNITSITRIATGTYRVIMTTAMQNSSYCVVANATYYQGVVFTTNCSVSIISSTEFEIFTTFNSSSSAGAYNSVNVNFVVFQ